MKKLKKNNKITLKIKLVHFESQYHETNIQLIQQYIGSTEKNS